jgi:hypothetical protein
VGGAIRVLIESHGATSSCLAHSFGWAALLAAGSSSDVESYGWLGWLGELTELAIPDPEWEGSGQLPLR